MTAHITQDETQELIDPMLEVDNIPGNSSDGAAVCTFDVNTVTQKNTQQSQN